MAARHDDNDGSDIFWPGYVDATTNLILNLLFLLTILIVAVFMFALELGRSTKIESVTLPDDSVEVSAQAVPVLTAELIQENKELKLEVERLKSLVSEKAQADEITGGVQETAEASKYIAGPQSGVEQSVVANFELLVRFKDEAVTFTDTEHDRLLEELKPILPSEKATIHVEVPVGFSETKRIGFYRAMAVRNLLIESGISGEVIDVEVVEVASAADPSLVRVRSY